MQQSFDFYNQTKLNIEELFQAYFDCRKNKRKTTQALEFELEYQDELIKLHQEINNFSYQPRRSIAFIINKPVKREIFAGHFRNRIIHHLIFNKLNPLFEKEFIHDSYSCRVGKGTSYGIKRIDHFIKRCSLNYTKDCYILKLDICGFFMSIDKKILFKKLEKFVLEKYKNKDYQILLYLCKKVIFNNPCHNYTIKGKISNWYGLPKNKSLFYSKKNCGLPIGNLTSQFFANFYLNEFDRYLKHKLKIHFYGRYVDDFVIIHGNKEVLKKLIDKIRNFLKIKLNLILHPDKIYLQNYQKGVMFLGSVIKPNRIYLRKRTFSNFYKKVNFFSNLIDQKKIVSNLQDKFLSSLNSYLGLMFHYQTYRLRKKILKKYLSCYWNNWVILIDNKKFKKKIKILVLIHET